MRRCGPGVARRRSSSVLRCLTKRTCCSRALVPDGTYAAVCGNAASGARSPRAHAEDEQVELVWWVRLGEGERDARERRARTAARDAHE